MESMSTLSQVMNKLLEKGYNKNLEFINGGIKASDGSQYTFADFKVDKVYRFEGMSNPDDNSILYSISTLTGLPIGVIVDGYGISSVNTPPAFIEKLSGL